jgi:hypothetical protein
MIYTEDKNRNRIIELVQKRFSGFTIMPTFGFFGGKPEASLKIEIWAEPWRKPLVIELAEEIRKVNAQRVVSVGEMRFPLTHVQAHVRG